MVEVHTLLRSPRGKPGLSFESLQKEKSVMLSGKHFRFNRSVTGIQLENGTASVVSIPTDSVIRVLAGPDANGRLPGKGIVYVIWEEHTVAIFAVDIEARASEIQPQRNQDHTGKSASA